LIPIPVNPLIATIITMMLTIVVTQSLIEHTIAKDVTHLKLDITFFVICTLSMIVIFHILIKNRKEIFELR